jgi:uncharacterized C2H2 Zn-finger protein
VQQVRENERRYGMKCPKCGNLGFKSSKDVPVALRSIAKENYNTFNIRYLICMQCGYRFKTQETFYEEVNAKVEKLPAKRQ